MKQNFYFKHDAPSATNPKLAKLLQKEGARGYGVYWLLIELLRLQTDFSCLSPRPQAWCQDWGTRKKRWWFALSKTMIFFRKKTACFFLSD